MKEHDMKTMLNIILLAALAYYIFADLRVNKLRKQSLRANIELLGLQIEAMK